MNNIQTTARLPPGITPQNRNAQFNNAYAAALAAGDPRYTVKNYDRGGLSRGASQWNQAGVDAAASLADGIAKAYAADQGTAQYNANALLRKPIDGHLLRRSALHLAAPFFAAFFQMASAGLAS